MVALVARQAMCKVVLLCRAWGLQRDRSTLRAVTLAPTCHGG